MSDSPEKIYPGQKVRFLAKFVDADDDPGNPDGGVSFTIYPSSGSTTTYVFGTDSEVTQPGSVVGTYACDIVVSASGLWKAKAAGSGSITAVDWDELYVHPALVA